MDTVWAVAEAYSTVVPAAILIPPVKAGNMVAAELPSLKVPEVRVRVAVEVNWSPPSAKILPPVTSPIVKLLIVSASPRVTPAVLLLLIL